MDYHFVPSLLDKGNFVIDMPVLTFELNYRLFFYFFTGHVVTFTLLKPTHALISKHSFTFTLKH
jgi:hypothetical protein